MKTQTGFYKKINFKFIIICIILAVLLVNLVKSWINLSDRLNFIKDTKIKLAEEKNEQENLKRELARTESRDFIEKQARDKLNLGKEGEFVILFPSPVLIASPTPVPEETNTNWEKWAQLFL